MSKPIIFRLFLDDLISLVFEESGPLADMVEEGRLFLDDLISLVFEESGPLADMVEEGRLQLAKIKFSSEYTLEQVQTISGLKNGVEIIVNPDGSLTARPSK